MRELVKPERIRALMTALGQEVRDPTRVYFVGGASALLEGWRESTIDVDLKITPENTVFAILAELKNRLRINIETAAPDQFIPPLPGWEDRSVFVAQVGKVSFFHLDFYSQALAKIERGFEQDMADVREMESRGLIEPEKVLELFARIEPDLVRYPALDPESFRAAVESAFSN